MDVLSTLPTKESDALEKLLTIIHLEQVYCTPMQEAAIHTYIYEMVEEKLKIKFLNLEIASKAKPSVLENPTGKRDIVWGQGYTFRRPSPDIPSTLNKSFDSSVD